MEAIMKLQLFRKFLGLFFFAFSKLWILCHIFSCSRTSDWIFTLCGCARLAAGMGFGVRSMPTVSFGWGGLMLKDPKPPMNPKETSLTTHPEASTKMYGINKWKRGFNNRSDHEKLDLSLYFSLKNWTNQAKRNVLKIIPYFASALCK